MTTSTRHLKPCALVYFKSSLTRLRPSHTCTIPVTRLHASKVLQLLVDKRLRGTFLVSPRLRYLLWGGIGFFRRLDTQHAVGEVGARTARHRGEAESRGAGGSSQASASSASAPDRCAGGGGGVDGRGGDGGGDGTDGGGSAAAGGRRGRGGGGGGGGGGLATARRQLRRRRRIAIGIQ
jgi:hypothetical protein